MAAPPGLAAPPLPPHLQPDQRLTAGILPASPPHAQLHGEPPANGGGSWSVRQHTPQQPLVGQHAAGGSPEHAAKSQLQAAYPTSGQAAIAASQPIAGSASSSRGGATRDAAAIVSANAGQSLSATQGVPSPLATTTVSNAASTLPPALWPPRQGPAQPQLRALPAAPGVPGQLPRQWLPPPGVAWSAAPSAMVPLVLHGPHALSLPTQPVAPHLQLRPPPFSGAGGRPQTTLPASAPHVLGSPGMAVHLRPNLTPLQGGGAAQPSRPVTAEVRLRPPQPAPQRPAGIQRPLQQSMQQQTRQPYPAAPSASNLQRSAGPPHSTAVSYAAGGRPPPQKRLPTVRPPQGAAVSLAALQQWAQQAPRAPSAGAAPAHQHATLMPGAADLGPAGPRLQPQQPAWPAAQGSQPLMTTQQPRGAEPPSAMQATGAMSMHYAQVRVPTPPERCWTALLVCLHGQAIVA